MDKSKKKSTVLQGWVKSFAIFGSCEVWFGISGYFRRAH